MAITKAEMVRNTPFWGQSFSPNQHGVILMVSVTEKSWRINVLGFNEFNLTKSEVSCLYSKNSVVDVQTQNTAAYPKGARTNIRTI